MAKGLWGLLLGGCVLVTGQAWAQTGDARILAAREALRTGDRATLERLAAQRQPHELDGYVQYWLLFNKLARPEAPPAHELQAFIDAHPGSLLAERLRADWLRRLARDGQWRSYLALFPAMQRPDEELRCHAWYARQLLGDAQVAVEVSALWTEQVSHHAACEPVLRTLAIERRVSPDDIWWRIRRQIEGRDTAPANTTLAWLPAGEAPSVADFNRAVGNPGQFLGRLPPDLLQRRSGRELVLAAITRLARENPEAAYLQLLRLRDQLGADKVATAYAALALRASYRQMPQAVEWFAAAGDIPLSAEQRAWRVRTALRAGDWGRVRQTIEALPDAERDTPDWTYWLARAHAALGSPEPARLLY